jgi:predicted lipoprotein with Yx(FWY)xxD motif
MRNTPIPIIMAALSACVLLALPASRAWAGNKPDKEEQPSNVALIDTGGAAGWVYQHFPSNVRLYIYDKDPPGKSTCNDGDGCAGVWPALIAPDDAKPLGYWTPIKRDHDPRLQWAYKNRAVYLHFHDSPDQPTGNGVGGVWHFLEP